VQYTSIVRYYDRFVFSCNILTNALFMETSCWIQPLLTDDLFCQYFIPLSDLYVVGRGRGDRAN